MVISGFFAIHMMQSHAIRASAVEFQLKSALLSPDDYGDNKQYFDQDEEGKYYYYRVTLFVKENEGFCGSGFKILYDYQNFEIVFKAYKKPLVEDMEAVGSLATAYSYNDEQGYLAIGTIGDDDSKETGPFCCFYLKAEREIIDENPNLSDHVVSGIDVDMLVDSRTDPLPEVPTLPEHVSVLYYSYFLGDISGDETIDIDDAVYLQQFVKKYGRISVDTFMTLLADEKAKYQGLYVETTLFEEIFTLVPIDINGDGYIDTMDSTALLEHYTRVVVAELPPEADDLIGTKQYVYHEIEI